MAYDVNNFLIDRVLKGVMVDSDYNVNFSINQITNPSLNCTTETSETVDAMGATIMSFQRSKQAEFTAENSLFDLGLAAAQFGSEKQIASTDNKIVTPIFETIKVTTGQTKITLKHQPLETIQVIHALKGDETLGTKYTNSSAASATAFVHTEDSKEITVPTGLADGTRLFVIYEYEAESAVAVNNNAIDVPKTGKFIMEVLGCDVCDTTKLIHAYVVFPVAKLTGEVDFTFTNEGTHSFTITCMQNYCDPEKILFSIIVPDEE